MTTDSLERRLKLAGDVRYAWERNVWKRIGSSGPLARAAMKSGWAAVEAAKHMSRIAIDLVECVRTRSVVPELGDVELALHDLHEPVAQHPRFASHVEDRANNAMVAMHVGVDLIRDRGRYYVLENNIGPSINERRRALYDLPLDPIVSGMVQQATGMGFKRLVPIALRWKDFHLAEFRAAEARFGVRVDPAVCPLPRERVRRIVGLPVPLEPDTLYVVHNGLWTSAIRFIDNKWLMSRWLAQALELLFPDTNLALPRTREELMSPLVDNGPRWPNLIVKLADGQRSERVVAARFETEQQAREALGLVPGGSPPPRLRQSLLDMLIGRDRMLFQDFIPPELDAAGCAQMIRLHMLVSPSASSFLSAHLRVARMLVPERVPSGLLEDGTAYIFNEAEYRLLPPGYEDEIRAVADQLSQAMHFGIAKTFQTRVSLDAEGPSRPERSRPLGAAPRAQPGRPPSRG
ncbi:hypothetical protein WME90_21275 [Sorangium sp. So ce375]|uniref:hypothetical protein n=1 Tax=Sorangium sp. So ce375 TaxID=3133306 RepID=UPI003F5C330B